MRTKSDQVTDALDVLIGHGVKLEEIFERYRASIVESAAKDYVSKERKRLCIEILAVLHTGNGVYVWRDDSSKVEFDNEFMEFYLNIVSSWDIIKYKKLLIKDKIPIRELEYVHKRLVEQPEFRPAQESLLEAA
jgi:hypothetical protein